MSGFKFIRKATRNDMPFILELEARPENTYVHAYDEATHLKHLSSSQAIYFIAEDEDNSPIGYAILFENETGAIEWRRIIMDKPGGGAGTQFMQAVTDHVKAEGHKKIWLDVYPENARARRVYRNLGFNEVGTEPNPNDPSIELIVMERLL